MTRSVGITRYVHSTLMRGKSFYPRGQKGCVKRTLSGKSMSIGRHTDRAFQHIFLKTSVAGLMPAAVRRAQNVAATLSTAGVCVCAVQVPVVCTFKTTLFAPLAQLPPC